MLDIPAIVNLLGYSEKNAGMLEILAAYGIKMPLKRPERGEDQVNFETESGLEFCLVEAEDFQNFSDRHTEGELILSTVFIIPKRLKGQELILPYGLTFDLTRDSAYELLGPSEWCNNRLDNHRWRFDGIRILIGFGDGGETVREISISSDIIRD